MAIKHSPQLAWPEGVTPVTIVQWADSLPADQKEEFTASHTRQMYNWDQAETAGDLVRDGMSQIWKDNDTRLSYNDPVWLGYAKRYHKETQTQIIDEPTEV
jgi:hypothetical protein